MNGAINLPASGIAGGGSGSGLNADLVDGLHAASFLRSDATDTASGRIAVTGAPTGSGVGQGTLYVNPTTATSGQTLFGVADNGTARFQIFKDGNVNLEGNAAIGNDAVILANAALNARNLANGTGNTYGVYARADDAGGTTNVYGLLGSAVASGSGNSKTKYGVYGQTSGVGTGWGYGVYGGGDTGMLGVGSITGVEGTGDLEGGCFQDGTSSGYSAVAYGTYKIQGSGSVAFVQNHPVDKDRVIVYNSPEGDEVATYTRGSARLTGGIARVRLGETFAWVTNPAVGLTAHITPRGADAGLYVESVTPEELVVRGREGGDVFFDYIVHGLRIGFEEVSIVQKKRHESRIPSMADHVQLYADQPELRQYDALERWKAMRRDAGDTSPLDLGRAKALTDAVGEFDPAIHQIAERHAGDARPDAHAGPGSGPATPAPPAGSETVASGADRQEAHVVPVAGLSADADGNIYARSLRANLADVAQYLPASGPVTAGDVLVVDRDDPTRVRLADSAADEGVVGIAAGEPGVALEGGMAPITAADPELAAVLASASAQGDKERAAEAWRALVRKFRQTNAPVALSGVVLCKADAGPGAIRVGDLLVTSPTPGHAMRADSASPGTVFAKALQPLDSGTGVIRVLIGSH